MEDYEALYRKHRPKDFDEVVGQGPQLAYLKKIAAEKKPGHAYLFSGGRGVGKTSLARIFARSLLVSSEDIYELDAASNRGIDEVRALRESVHTLPFSSPYKVYILDEAHMLTKEASNALLKTLEEPPAHVIFILATTEKHKLLDTIVSRCQVVDFALPTHDILSAHLIVIAEKEGYALTKEASLVVAKEAKGSFRDALGILEKVLRISDKKNIDEKDTRTVLGFSDEETVRAVVRALFSKDPAAFEGAFVLAKQKISSAEVLFDEMLEITRLLLLFRVGVLTERDSEFGPISLLSKDIGVQVQSKHLLFLLEKSALLKQNEERGWLVLEMVLFELQASFS